jgi:hypothetical protein
MKNNTEDALTIKQVAAILYLDTSKAACMRITRMISAGTLKATKMQGLGPRSPYLVSRKELDRLIAQQEKSAPAPLRD